MIISFVAIISCEYTTVFEPILYDLTYEIGSCQNATITSTDGSLFSFLFMDESNYELYSAGESFFYQVSCSCNVVLVCNSDCEITSDNSYAVLINENLILPAVLDIDIYTYSCSESVVGLLIGLIIIAVIGGVTLFCFVFIIYIIADYIRKRSRQSGVVMIEVPQVPQTVVVQVQSSANVV